MSMRLIAESGDAGVTLLAFCGQTLHLAALGVGALGVVRGALMFIRSEFSGSSATARHHLRMDLGYYLLLGLEFLVAADIIETLLAPDLEHVLVLGAIVVIRTVISFSLNWELNQHAKHATVMAE